MWKADRYLIGCSAYDCCGDCDGSLAGDTEIILLIRDMRASSAALAWSSCGLPGVTDLCAHDQSVHLKVPVSVTVADAYNEAESGLVT